MSIRSVAFLHRLFFEVLPTENVVLAFAYGSGAFKQHGQDEKQMQENMIDFVIGVKDSEAWHRQNLAQNWKHYSISRRLGAEGLSKLQDNFVARCFCNTLVPIPSHGVRIKYSVIKLDHLMADLLDWETLYVSGRLHKPVLQIIGPESDCKSELKAALDLNLQSALHAALLLLPERVGFEKLFQRIVSLSYNGDFRMIVGEDKGKILNIVKANMDRFQELYLPLLKSSDLITVQGNQIMQDQSIPANYHHLELLPKCVQWRLQDYWNKRHRKNWDLEESLWALARHRDCPTLLDKALRSIVFKSSVQQTMKNVLTAGFRRSLAYGSRKFFKWLKSVRR